MKKKKTMYEKAEARAKNSIKRMSTANLRKKYDEYNSDGRRWVNQELKRRGLATERKKGRR